MKVKKSLYSGLTKAPERIKSSDYKERKQLLFKSTSFGDDKDRVRQKLIYLGHILQATLLIIIINLREIMIF